MPNPALSCRVCGLVHEGTEIPEGYQALCVRCGSKLGRRSPFGWHLSAAFTLCALFLYGPANLFPILRMSLYGRVTENTIYSGVVRFHQEGDTFIAVVVFLASILVPFLKILGLLFLLISARFRWQEGKIWRTRVYRTIDQLGRWAMLDVFVLGILIALIKMGKMANVVPGKGAAAFTLVVMFTLLASATFDSETIWEKENS